MDGLECLVDGADQVAVHSVEVRAVTQPPGEGSHDGIGVITGPVEPAPSASRPRTIAKTGAIRGDPNALPTGAPSLHRPNRMSQPYGRSVRKPLRRTADRR